MTSTTQAAMVPPRRGETVTEQTITLTEAQLKALLAEAAQTANGTLPPGAYREGGRIWRDVWVPTAGTTDPKTGTLRAGRRKVRRPVHVTSDTTPDGLLKAKRAAYHASPQMDFYHPDYGWLRNGNKVEVDHPSNLGSAAEEIDVVYDDEPDAAPAPVPDAVQAPPSITSDAGGGAKKEK